MFFDGVIFQIFFEGTILRTTSKVASSEMAA